MTLHFPEPRDASRLKSQAPRQALHRCSLALFMPFSIQVYTVGPNYAHAEGRKSPVVDGRVLRGPDGKELRCPILLTAFEKEIARKVTQVFKQNICGFDLLRTQVRDPKPGCQKAILRCRLTNAAALGCAGQQVVRVRCEWLELCQAKRPLLRRLCAHHPRDGLDRRGTVPDCNLLWTQACADSEEGAGTSRLPGDADLC